MEQLKINESGNGNGSAQVLLKKRDLEILKFVLEMKFSSIDEVYEKFFKVKRNGKISKSDWWARERVYQLRKEGLLKVVKFYTEQKSFYMATAKAYHLLRDSYPFEHMCFPHSEIEVRTFRHDWLVTKCRLVLEGQKEVNGWVSEKLMKSESGLLSGLPKKYMPDGLFLDRQGQRWAFELEISMKAKSRYQQKVRLYSRIMGQSALVKGSNFSKCLFICQKESVAEVLRKQILPYGDRFEVKMLSDLIGVETATGGIQ